MWLGKPDVEIELNIFNSTTIRTLWSEIIEVIEPNSKHQIKVSQLSGPNKNKDICFYYVATGKEIKHFLLSNTVMLFSAHLHCEN